MAYATVTLTGTYQTPDQTPHKGHVEIIPSERVIKDTTGDVILTGRVKVDLDAQGAFTVALPATDDESLNPTGFGYTIAAKLHSSHPPAVSFSLPASLGATTVEDLTPVDPATFEPTTTYAEKTELDAVAATIPTTAADVNALPDTTQIPSTPADVGAEPAGLAQATQDTLAATYIPATIVAPGINGVIGDGAADDTAAIQALIDTTPKGGTVYFARPTGGDTQDSYRISSPLRVTTKSIRFLGSGRDVYAVNINMPTGTGPLIEVKAAGFVLQDIGLVGDGGANGAGATTTGLDLYGDNDGNIDARVTGSSFQYLAIGVRTRGRNAAIRDDTQFSNCLKGVVIDGTNGTYHTGPNANQNRANTVQGCRFHNIGAAATDAAVEITTAAKVLHMAITGNYFDSNGLGRHIVAAGTSSNPAKGITCRNNKHTETSAHVYDFTYVANSTIAAADISGNAAAPTDHHAVKLTNCDTVTVADVFALQVGTSGVHARSCTKIRVQDCNFRAIGISTATGHGIDFDATNSFCRFDRITVESTDGYGFTGEPTSSSMTDCDFISCTLGRMNTRTVVNRGASGVNTYTEGKFGRLEDEGRQSYDFAAGVAKPVATVAGGGNYSSFLVEVEYTSRNGASFECFVVARRNVLTENGAARFTTIGTDATATASVAFAAAGSNAVTVSITTTAASNGNVVVRASAGGAANATNPRGVTVTMAA